MGCLYWHHLNHFTFKRQLLLLPIVCSVWLPLFASGLVCMSILSEVFPQQIFMQPFMSWSISGGASEYPHESEPILPSPHQMLLNSRVLALLGIYLQFNVHLRLLSWLKKTLPIWSYMNWCHWSSLSREERDCIRGGQGPRERLACRYQCIWW